MLYLGGFLISTNYIYFLNAEIFPNFFFFHKYIFVKEIGESFFNIQKYYIYWNGIWQGNVHICHFTIFKPT
jgi:hypothetical protein